jgi:hypothetical protein
MTSIFPTAYFGSISYYKSLVQTDAISFELYEHYVKQTLRNRMTILGANGKLNLSIPVEKPNGNKTLTKDIQISYAENWQKNHWKAIESAYSPSPYFEHFESEVKELIFSTISNLVDFNFQIHLKIMDWLSLPIQNQFTESYIEESNSINDFRKTNWPIIENSNYIKVFNVENVSESDLSILDAIFNLGPMARNLLIQL